MSIPHILIAGLFLAFFCWLILRLPFFRDEHIPRKAFVGAFLLKVLAGFFLWAIYSFYYPMEGHSDAFNYFDEAMILHEALYEDPDAYAAILFGVGTQDPDAQKYIQRTNHWVKPYNYGVMNDNRTIIRANMLCRLLSFGYYHVHTAIFCFCSFLGMMALYKSFVRFVPKKRYGAYFAVFLIPSLVFWGSGVLKEGVLLFGLGFFVHHWVRLIEERSWWGLPWALLFSVLLITIKTYVLLALIPGLISYGIARSFRGRHTLTSFLVGHGVLGFGALSLPLLGVPYNISGMLQLKQKDFYNVAEMHDAGSVIHAPSFDNTMELLASIPHALWNALFRPHLFEMEKFLYFPPAIENAFFLLCLVPVVLYWKRPSRGVRPFYAWAISFILILGTVIGLVTPVLGAIIRYQIPLLPFYIFVIIASIDQEKWDRGISKLHGIFGSKV